MGTVTVFAPRRTVGKTKPTLSRGSILMGAHQRRLGLRSGLLGLLCVWACSSENPTRPDLASCGPGEGVPLTSLHGYIAFVANGQLGAVCPDGSDLRAALGPVADTLFEDMDPSPDGSRVLLSYSGRLDLLDVASGTSTPVAVPTPSESDREHSATWAPDGRTIAYVINDSEIAIGEVSGNAVTNVRTLVPPQAACVFPRNCEFYYSLDWSPIGDRIAFERSIATGPTSLGVVEVTSGNEISVETPDQSYFTSVRSPTWSPDGTRLAFGYNDRTIPKDPRLDGVWVINADGSGARKLADGLLAESLSWSPDGSHIAYLLGGDLWIVPAAGGTAREIAHLPKPMIAAQWVP